MTTHVIKGIISFSCDGCPEAHEGQKGDNFNEAWAEARAAGWEGYQQAGQWNHRCPTCATD